MIIESGNCYCKKETPCQKKLKSLWTIKKIKENITDIQLTLESGTNKNNQMITKVRLELSRKLGFENGERKGNAPVSREPSGK
ncbi:hypothetical protein D3Z50_21145 [Clostridiaceae bacterium]|nr:hypothetical protein [Clostridiaceae bacterium]